MQDEKKLTMIKIVSKRIPTYGTEVLPRGIRMQANGLRASASKEGHDGWKKLLMYQKQIKHTSDEGDDHATKQMTHVKMQMMNTPWSKICILEKKVTHDPKRKHTDTWKQMIIIYMSRYSSSHRANK